MDRPQSGVPGRTGGSTEPVERPLPVNHELEMARDAISKGVFRLSLMGKMNPRTALELIAIFQGATRLFNVDCSFGVLDAIRTALSVSPVETLADGATLPEVDLQPWMWANQLCDETACYSRVVFDGGSLAMYHNQRMEENFMETAELYRRVRQLRLLPLFHWTTIVHPMDIPVFYEAMGPIMVGHGTARQTDVIVKCRKKCGAYVPCLVTFRCARGPTEGKGGIVVRIWPLETRVFHPPPPGEPRGQPCVIESVDPGPTPPPTACSPSPPLPTFSSCPASASLPPVAPPMAHAPLVAAPLPSVPPPPVFAGPSMARPPMACPPMAPPPPPPPPPMLPRPQLVVPYPPHIHTHPSHNSHSHSHSNPYVFHPVPDAQPWAPPLDLLPVSQLPPPQAVSPRVDMPADEMQTLWEVFGGTGECPRPEEAVSPITAPAAKFRRNDNGSRGGTL